MSSDDLHSQFEKFTTKYYKPFSEHFQENNDSWEQIKQAAVSKLSQSELKTIMKSVEKKLFSECQSLQKTQKEFEHMAKIEIVVISFMKQQISKHYAESVTDLDQRIASVDLYTSPIFAHMEVV